MSCQERAAGSPKRTCAKTSATCRQLFVSGNLQRGSGSTPVPATPRTTAAEAPQPGKVSLTALRPLLLSALSVQWAVYGKLRAGLGLRGSPAAGRRPILGHGRVGRLAGCSAPASPPTNSARALPSAPLHVPHTGRCTAPLATSSPEGSARR